MDENYIYGRNTITQLLMEENPKLSKVFLSFAASGTAVNKIYTLAKQHKVPISKMDNRKFKELEKRIGCDAGGSQGVIALRELVQTLDDTSLLKKALAKEKYPIIIALDNIEDPHNLGAIARTVEQLVRSGGVDVIVIDSVAALTPRAEIEGEMGDSQMGSQARLMSQAMRKLQAAIGKSKCLCIFTNQLRSKIGVIYGNPETTTGGNALKFYASVRMDIRRKDVIKDGQDIIGNRVKVKIVKNKVAPPFKEAEL